MTTRPDKLTVEAQAVWEMTHLIIAPKKVFRNIYYYVRTTFILRRASAAY